MLRHQKKQIENTMTDLLSKIPAQVKNVNQIEKLIDLLVANIKATKPESSNNNSQLEVPERLIQLPAIQKEIKKLIIKDSTSHGIEWAAKKYTLSSKIICKWVQDGKGGEANRRTRIPSPKTECNGIIGNGKSAIGIKRKSPEKNEGSTTELSSLAEEPSSQNEAKAQPKPRTRHKVYEAVFSTFNKSEKERILHDFLILGKFYAARKWGVDRRVLDLYIKNTDLFETEREKMIWLQMQGEYIRGKMGTIESNEVREEIENILSSHKDQISIAELCSLSFDRGIAIAAARYSINLFKLEHFLKEICPSPYAEMEKNQWYLIPASNFTLPRSKLEIVKLARAEGFLYTSKKCRLGTATIRRYLRHYEKNGPQGLDNSRKFLMLREKKGRKSRKKVTKAEMKVESSKSCSSSCSSSCSNSESYEHVNHEEISISS